MSTFTILDAYSSLRRELSLILASQLKSQDFGHKQIVILYRLTQSPLSMSELACYCHSDPAATSRTVAALQKAGLVRRIADSKDSRKHIIELTKKGKNRATEAINIRSLIAAKLNNTLSPKEQISFTKLLNKVVQGLQTKE